MKKLIALGALVAMVAISSVAFAATGDVPVSVTVDAGVILDMDACDTPGGLIVASLGANAETSASCNFIVSANGTHDVYVTDTNDGTEGCTQTGCIAGPTDFVEGVDDFPGSVFTGQDPAAGTAEVGYYMSTAAGDTVATCTGTTSVCAAQATETGRPIDDETNVNDLDNFTLGMAVSTNTDQVSEAYSDTWVLNLIVGS
ncbi:hypothetical protein ACFL3C_02695 [Patescibacteria group bacterium]